MSGTGVSEAVSSNVFRPMTVGARSVSVQLKPNRTSVGSRAAVGVSEITKVWFAPGLKNGPSCQKCGTKAHRGAKVTWATVVFAVTNIIGFSLIFIGGFVRMFIGLIIYVLAP